MEITFLYDLYMMNKFCWCGRNKLVFHYINQWKSIKQAFFLDKSEVN